MLEGLMGGLVAYEIVRALLLVLYYALRAAGRAILPGAPLPVVLRGLLVLTAAAAGAAVYLPILGLTLGILCGMMWLVGPWWMARGVACVWRHYAHVDLGRRAVRWVKSLRPVAIVHHDNRLQPRAHGQPCRGGTPDNVIVLSRYRRTQTF